MIKILLSVVVVNALIQGIRAAMWSASFPEGATVDSCAGDVSVTIPWKITLAAGEEIANAEFFYHDVSEELIGTFTHGYFLAMPSYSQRVQQENTTGLLLRHVTDSDAGNYSVEVAVRDRTSGSMTTLHRWALLVVYSQSKAVADATVKVRQEPVAKYDNSTGQFHVTMTCASQGRQPPAVIWTLPSGVTKLEVSTSASGNFSLLVPNPVSSGNYTCSVHPSTPVARCLPANSPALKGDTVYLDRTEARLALLEAKEKDLQSKNDALTAIVLDLKNKLDQHLLTGHV